METEETKANTTAYTSLLAKVPGDQPTDAQAAEPTQSVASTGPVVQADTPATEVTPQAVSLSPHAPNCLQALATLMQARLLWETEHIHMDGIAILLHLLHETPVRHIALSILSPARTAPETEAIWSKWSTHLDNEAQPCMDGIPTHVFFIRVLTHPSSNPGDTAEVAELLRMCIQDTVRVETLQAHTVEATQEVVME